MLQLSFYNFRKNSYIFVEGTPDNDHFFIIQSGKVCCYHENEVPGSAPVTLGPGDFVGVIACMSGHFQIENVVALTDVKAICVRREQYPDLIRQNTPVAMKIIRRFAQNMRSLNDSLTRITLKTVAAESFEQIFKIAQYYESVEKEDIATYAYYQYLKSCPGGENFEEAKERFVLLKPTSRAVYFESDNDLVRIYPKDTMIFSECQTGADMFILQEGSVKITKVVDNSEVTLAVLKKGDMFGEMALLENKIRSANAIAHEECKVMVINRKNFDNMVATQPQIISRLTTTLADRIWAMYRQLENTQLRDPYVKVIDMISLQVEKQKLNFTSIFPYFTNLTPEDIMDMCGISRGYENKNMTDAIKEKLAKDPNIKIIDEKICIPDVQELIKQASCYRKQKMPLLK